MMLQTSGLKIFHFKKRFMILIEQPRQLAAILGMTASNILLNFVGGNSIITLYLRENP